MGMSRRVALLIVMTITAVGCDERMRDVAGPTPGLQPTFSSIQRDIFSTPDASGRVACTGCHNAQSAAVNGNLNLAGASAYGQLVNVPSTGRTGALRVIPSDAENSYLVHKLEGRPGISGERMPPGGPFLTAPQIDVVKRWITLGARND